MFFLNFFHRSLLRLLLVPLAFRHDDIWCFDPFVPAELLCILLFTSLSGTNQKRACDGASEIWIANLLFCPIARGKMVLTTQI